jgi:hypothetical protein
MRVGIVLDPAYRGLERLVEEMPVWAVDSPLHRSTAGRLWEAHGKADATQGVTLFKVSDEDDPEGNCISILAEVDSHHGLYSSGRSLEILNVIGTAPSAKIRKELSDYGFTIFEQTPDGFVARVE